MPEAYAYRSSPRIPGGSVAGHLRRFGSWFAPLLEVRCASCAKPVAPAGPGERFRTGGAAPVLCAACEGKLARRDAGYCPRCGDIAPFAQSSPAACGDCLTAPRPWGRFFFHAEYQGLLRDLILRFKNGPELALGNTLGRLLAGHPDMYARYDAIVPMPLHPIKLRERGFNQALELARPLARKLRAPLAPSLLARGAYTHPQAGLSLEERKMNVRGIFEAPHGVSGKSVLFVDDIATTGASLESAAVALAKAGAVAVDVAVVGRTPRHGGGRGR